MDLFKWAVKVSSKRFKPASLATYGSLYAKYVERLALVSKDGASVMPGAETVEQMVLALSMRGDYLTQKRTLALLQWIYATLQSAGHPLVDNTTEIKRLYYSDHRTTHMTQPDNWQGRFIAAAETLAKGWKRSRLIAIASLLTDVALKTTELIFLEKTDISISAMGKINVGKGTDARSLPLSHETSVALNDWMAIHPAPLSAFLFVRDASGEPMDATTVWRQIGRLQKTAGLDSYSTGTGAIRAVKARVMLDNGVPLPTLARFLGHRNESSTAELTERVR